MGKKGCRRRSVLETGAEMNGRSYCVVCYRAGVRGGLDLKRRKKGKDCLPSSLASMAIGSPWNFVVIA